MILAGLVRSSRVPLLRFSAVAARSPRFSFTFVRQNSQLPQQIDDKKDLRSNELVDRIPKFPFHKDIAPSLIPKADTPRVGPNVSFSQLIERLKSSAGVQILYMAESHRLYFLACFAFAFIAAYNLFDILDRSVPPMIRAYQTNEIDGIPIENLSQLLKRFGIVFGLCAAYIVTGVCVATFPSRLVRRIEYVPGVQPLVRLVTHPLIPGRASPVITVPVAQMSIGQRTKVWTGDGFYGVASKSSFFFFLWEKGRRLPWVVDRSGWFWGDGRVYDVVFGKEPVVLAEKGLSYDDMLKRQALAAEKKKAQLRRELGPAWRVKAAGQLMKEDVQRFSNAGRAAVLNSLSKPKAGAKSIEAQASVKESTRGQIDEWGVKKL